MSAKADRLLTEGRVAVTYASADGRLSALVLGDSGEVWLVERRDDLWRCQCPSWRYRSACSHVSAVWRISG